tara:strand:+ start:2141 stop:3025 length:885 start_codon:yes stop_codon:yes gene_type:complete
MNVLLAGASGLIGKAIKAELIRAGNTVYPLIRNKRLGPCFYMQENNEIFLDSSIHLDAVINLAGVNISERRWSHAVKDQIIQSRVQTTSTLSTALASLEKKPDVYLSASAIGYYGTDSNSTLCESSPAGNDFLARLAVGWERATEPAKAEGIRTCLLRFGLVLSPGGGMVKNLLLPFRLGCVGPIGSGLQMLSWVSLDDTISVMKELLENREFNGAINIVSGQPVSSQQFAKALSGAIKRPALPRIPARAVRVMFGEVADAALLVGAEVKSERMSELGIKLQHTDIQECLTDIM